MKITSVRTTRLEGSNERLIGYASVTIDNAIAIHDIRIIKSDEKVFIAFPSKRVVNKDTQVSTFEDIIHPINSETRKIFEDAILEEFNKLA